jgi:hypothetical protein
MDRYSSGTSLVLVGKKNGQQSNGVPGKQKTPLWQRYRNPSIDAGRS